MECQTELPAVLACSEDAATAGMREPMEGADAAAGGVSATPVAAAGGRAGGCSAAVVGLLTPVGTAAERCRDKLRKRCCQWRLATGPPRRRSVFTGWRVLRGSYSCTTPSAQGHAAGDADEGETRHGSSMARRARTQAGQAGQLPRPAQRTPAQSSPAQSSIAQPR